MGILGSWICDQSLSDSDTGDFLVYLRSGECRSGLPASPYAKPTRNRE